MTTYRPMTYVEHALEAINRELPGLDPTLSRLYALLALTVGTGVTLEHVHDAWAIWRDLERPDHQSIIPFGQLTTEVQELDRKYVDGIRAAAQTLTEAPDAT